LGYIGAIILITIILKIIFYPDQLIAYVNQKKKETIKNELNEVDERKRRTNSYLKRKLFKKRKKELLKRSKIISGKIRFLFFVLQLFILIQFIHTLSNIDKGDLNYFWFNLSERDYTLLLPIIILITNLIEGIPTEGIKEKSELFIYIMINILIFGVAVFLNSSILIYWLSGSLFSLLLKTTYPSIGRHVFKIN